MFNSQSMVIFIIIIVSIILHEMAHAFVSYLLGSNVAKHQKRISLNPLNHIDPIMSLGLPLIMLISGGPVIAGAKPVLVDKYRIKWGDFGMAIVAISGPILNLIIAFIFFISLKYVHDVRVVEILFQSVIINLNLCLFNLLPIPPLDGSRVIYAFAPELIQNFFDQIEKYGIIVLYVIVFIFPMFIDGYISNGVKNIILVFENLI